MECLKSLFSTYRTNLMPIKCYGLVDHLKNNRTN